MMMLVMMMLVMMMMMALSHQVRALHLPHPFASGIEFGDEIQHHGDGRDDTRGPEVLPVHRRQLHPHHPGVRW